ncbi:hypothetical protein [Rhodococcus sp. PD04]|nr:hypothetical protein [Rhodococcus sp. PD04]WSE25648.1 hypothetical protein U9J23_26525 [Rhodococcus sp. PD04]
MASARNASNDSVNARPARNSAMVATAATPSIFERTGCASWRNGGAD